METHYSILSVLIRPEIQEKISLGLLLFDANKIFFNYSKNKLAAAKSLLTEDAYKLLKDLIKNIENKAIGENELLGSRNSKQLIFQDDMVVNSFSPEYFSYLSRYNNNLLSFSAPKEIDLHASDIIFRKLFSKFVDVSERIETGIPEQKPIEIFKIRNKPRLIRHFNIDKEVSSKDIPNLIMPVKVDLLGKNQIPVYVQVIDMDRRPYDIENDIMVLQSLYLAYKQNNLDSKAFIISNEPSLENKKQHQMWKDIRTFPLFEYVDVSESTKIVEYAEEHGVLPLIKEETDIDNDELLF